MATSEDILIADEISDALNGESFSIAFTSERLYVSDWDAKEELVDLQVGVWPAESAMQLWEREQVEESFRIGLSFAQKISAALRSDVDLLCDLVTEVKDFLELKGVTLADGRVYENTGWEYLARFAESRLDRNKGADGIVRYTGMFASAIVFDYLSME